MQQLIVSHFVCFYDFLLISVSACFEECSLCYNHVAAVLFLPFSPLRQEKTHICSVAED